MAASRVLPVIAIIALCLVQVSVCQDDNERPTGSGTDRHHITDSEIMKILLKAIKDTKKLRDVEKTKDKTNTAEDVENDKNPQDKTDKSDEKEDEKQTNNDDVKNEKNVIDKVTPNNDENKDNNDNVDDDKKENNDDEEEKDIPNDGVFPAQQFIINKGKIASTFQHVKDSNLEIAENLDTEMKIQDEPRRRNLPEHVQLWKDGKIPFCIKKESFVSVHENKIREVINSFNQHTCVQWEEVTCDSGVYHVIIETTNLGCISFVGYISGTGENSQILGLKEHDCLLMDTIEHEMLHTLGFEHEQSRGDRDSNIKILWENVEGRQDNHNLQKIQTNNFEVPYDLGSVLHYSVFAQANEYNKKTIELRIGEKFEFLTEEDDGLSFYDIMLVTRAYRCTDACIGKDNVPLCENGAFLAHKCNCYCPSGLEGVRCEKISNTTGCSEIFELKEGQKSILTSPMGKDGKYLGNMVCNYLIKAPKGYIIEATVTKMNISSYGKTRLRCRHWLEIKHGLIGQKGPVYCGQTSKPVKFSTLSNVKYYQHSNLMMMKFDSTADGPKGKGFEVEFVAKKSSESSKTTEPCDLNPCKNGATCTAFGHWKTEYTCHCQKGFTGRNCENGQQTQDDDFVFICGSKNERDCSKVVYGEDSAWSVDSHNHFTAKFDENRPNRLALDIELKSHSCLTFSCKSELGNTKCGLVTSTEVTFSMPKFKFGPYPGIEIPTCDCTDIWKTQTAEINVFSSNAVQETVKMFIDTTSAGKVTIDNIKILKGPCN